MCVIYYHIPTRPSLPAASSQTASTSSSSTSSSPYLLILAANRDEYLPRPTLSAGWHDFEALEEVEKQGGLDADDVLPLKDGGTRTNERGNQKTGSSRGKKRCLSGRDLGDPTGGTWLGLSFPSSSPPTTRSSSSTFPPATYRDTGRKRTLRIGALTNIHEESESQAGPSGVRDVADGGGDGKGVGKKSSRGGLLKDYLQLGNTSPIEGASRAAGGGGREAENRGDVHGDLDTNEWLDGLEGQKDRYAGFNLILFDIDLPDEGDDKDDIRDRRVTARYYSNRYTPSNSSDNFNDTSLSRYIIHRTGHNEGKGSTAGISNSIITEPFVKATAGAEKMGEVIEQTGGDEEGMVEGLFGLLGQTQVITSFPDFQKTISIPLLSMPLASAQPSTNINTPSPAPTPTTRPYGTRLSTVILVRRDGSVLFVERDRLWLDQREGVKDDEGDGVQTGEGRARMGGREDRRFEFSVYLDKE